MFGALACNKKEINNSIIVANLFTLADGNTRR